MNKKKVQSPGTKRCRPGPCTHHLRESIKPHAISSCHVKYGEEEEEKEEEEEDGQKEKERREKEKGGA
ncbi:hypothetical protein E2C01_033068 [Portunus trituberculatus]|uniref:Uncharacterized protein n=1 Tax=Portunus trituberculatus TaxID=210409 RepID=A0A5B7EXL2_PORTR|nr:hypothetical protein [Portunus trituberculatus]